MRPAIKRATASASTHCCRPRPIIGKSVKPAIASKPPSSPCDPRSKISTSPPVARLAKRRSKNSTALHWLNDARPVVLIGQTGVGKTFIAQATGLHACACGKSVLYLTLTTWLENLALARSSGTYLRYRDKLARPDIVIIDDFGMRKLSATEAQDLCELLEERSINKSTMFTTQLPLDHWSEVIADPVIADAIRDRLEHSALTLHITGESYRGVKARKLANKIKG
jgi:DNA replication protein DnaC